jgi:SPP1 family predicted phage head-tail adaptor
MNPGLLDEKITLEYPTSSSVDRYGQSIMTYASQSLFANVKKNSGGETTINGYVYNTATYVFTLRENNNINEKANITYASNKYNIVYVDELVYDGYVRVTGERRN